MAGEIKIGNLNRLIVLKKITTVVSSTGEETKTEVLYKTVYAQLNDLSGSENEDGKVMYLNVRKYIVRYNLEILTAGETMLITDIDGTYNIHSIEQIGRRDYLALKCSKRE